MKNSEWLSWATEQLHKNDISTARLDALVLLEDVSEKDRSWLIAHPEFEVTEQQLDTLSTYITRRSLHEPLAFIRKKTEFYGRDFYVNGDTLEPRPESEMMIELLAGLELENPVIVDVGTGSGALAITAQLELPKAQVSATEIDEKAIKVAIQNIENYKLRIEVIKTDLLKDVFTKTDVILANLPYVPNGYDINQAAQHEPKIAIFGGTDGLDLYRKMFNQLSKKSWKATYILTESLPFQHDELSNIARAASYQQIDEADFIQVFKAI